MGGRSNRRPAGNPFVPATAVYPEAASGLRPAGVFVLIGMVFAAVVARSVYVQVFAEGQQPDARREMTAPAPSFSIVDRSGVPLALSVETLDVTISPRSMWRSHTPDRMARRIAEALSVGGGPSGGQGERASIPAPAGPTVAEILERAMPPSFSAGERPGLVIPSDPVLLRFSGVRADAVRRYIATGGDAQRAGLAPVRGLELVALAVAAHEPAAWTLAMDPLVLLGEQVRGEQFGVPSASPDRWTRRLLDDLVRLVGQERILGALGVKQRPALEQASSIERRELMRAAVWAELVPTRFRVLVRGVDPVRGHRLEEVLKEEKVSSWQVQLVSRVERRHPTRPGGLPVAPHADLGLESP